MSAILRALRRREPHVVAEILDPQLDMHGDQRLTGVEVLANALTIRDPMYSRSICQWALPESETVNEESIQRRR